MKEIFAIIVLYLVLCISAWSWEFNSINNQEGWISENNINAVTVKDGKLTIAVNADKSDPHVSGPVGSYDGDKITGIEMRIKFSTEVSGGLLYFFPSAGGFGAYSYFIKDQMEWNLVHIDFNADQSAEEGVMKWAGEINNIRISFPDTLIEDYQVEIDWIRFVDDWVDNDGFEPLELTPWTQEGGNNLFSYQVTHKEFFAGLSSLEITGTGDYQRLQQDIRDGLKLEKGQSVSVVAAVKIPKDSWDSLSSLWFRIHEDNGKTENNSPEVNVTVFDTWIQIQSTLTLQYDSAERKSLSLQLLSKNPAGKKIYADAIFADVQEKPILNPGWPVNAVKLDLGQSITVDGLVSAEEYKGAQALVINKNTLQSIPDPFFSQYTHDGRISNKGQLSATPEDYTATYYFMWDEESLYAAISVQDDSYGFFENNPTGSDALQFVIAENPSIKKTDEMYLPTVAPMGRDGMVIARNIYDGWLDDDLMFFSTFAGSVDEKTHNWSVEIQVPWSAMVRLKTIFPPKVGDMIGFSVLSIDYDMDENYTAILEWFSCNCSTFPWEGNGLERLYFIDKNTSVHDWALF